MEPIPFPAGTLSNADCGYAVRPSRNQEIANLLYEVEELHNLHENEWSWVHTEESTYGNMCRGFYNFARKVSKVEVKIPAPYNNVLAYGLYKPYGYRNVLESTWGAITVNVTEYLGGGAAVVYYSIPEATFCNCTIRGRDLVALCALKLLASNVAIFGMKSIDHPAHPVRDGTYRANMPLMGIYMEQQGDLIHMESFFKEIAIGGSLFQFTQNNMREDAIRKSVELILTIPKKEDITIAGEPPYIGFL